MGWRTGQRLNDIARLRWSSIDLHRNLIHFHVAKLNSRAEVPPAPSLRDYLIKLPGPLHPDDCLFPGAAKQSLPSLKREFLGLTADAGVGTESFDALGLSFLLDPLAHLDPALVAALLGQESSHLPLLRHARFTETQAEVSLPADTEATLIPWVARPASEPFVCQVGDLRRHEGRG
jgi:integrase